MSAGTIRGIMEVGNEVKGEEVLWAGSFIVVFTGRNC